MSFSAIREEFSDIAPLWILKHCTTRWLSLEPSTLSSLLSVKVNNNNACYLNQELMSDVFITSAK